MRKTSRSASRAFVALKSFVWLMSVLVVLLFVLVPFLSFWLLSAGHLPPSLGATLRLLEGCQSLVMHLFVYTYVAFLGGCIASFLNVVAWRVPRGRSILGSSHCPICDHRLSMKDNVPVWGWLKNDGRCRHCQTPIAIRYLLVEVFLGGVFLILFVPEVLLGGVNLPAAPKLYKAGIEYVLFEPNVELLTTFAFHLVLLSFLFTTGTIASERNPARAIPWAIPGVAAVILWTLGCVYPFVVRVPWNNLGDAVETPVGSALVVLRTMGLGAVGGLLVGAIAGRIDGWFNRNADAAVGFGQLVVSFLMVGCALGWQAAVTTWVIWMALRITLRLAEIRFKALGKLTLINPVSLVMVATITQLLVWAMQYPALHTR